MGFFQGSTLLKLQRSKATVPKCGLCGLHKKCESPFMKPSGKGKRKILVVGEAPGKNEDEQGEPFVGKAGKRLKKTLQKIGLDPKRDCRFTNALICRPPQNATPTDVQIEYCNPNLTETIKEFDPIVVLAVGRAGVMAVLHGIWDQPFGAMGRWVGWQIPCRDLNTWIIPTYHPSYVLREESQAKSGTPIQRIFRKHLRTAAKIERKPYDKVPDWASEIEILHNRNKIVEAIDEFIKRGGPVGIDLECDMLKPDSKEGKIASAAISWRGKRTISFLWAGEKVIEAFFRLMKSERNPKIGHNLKYEMRWAMSKGQTEMESPAWCTMNTAHIVDNRRDICSLDFQLFVNFGVSPYASHISTFLEQRNSYSKNRIKEIEVNDLLLYNGIDALGCIKLAMKQRKFFGLDPL